MGTLSNILEFIQKKGLSNREFESAAGLSNGTLNNSANKNEISKANLEKILEKYSTELAEAGYHIIDFGPALNGNKAILTHSERVALEATIKDNLDTGINNYAQYRPLEMGDLTLTVGDYINLMREQNSFLQYVIKNGLVEMKTNLDRDHHWVEQYIDATATRLTQHMNTLYAGQVQKVKPKRGLPSRGGKVSGGRKKKTDGKDKDLLG